MPPTRQITTRRHQIRSIYRCLANGFPGHRPIQYDTMAVPKHSRTPNHTTAKRKPHMVITRRHRRPCDRPCFSPPPQGTAHPSPSPIHAAHTYHAWCRANPVGRHTRRTLRATHGGTRKRRLNSPRVSQVKGSGGKDGILLDSTSTAAVSTTSSIQVQSPQPTGPRLWLMSHFTYSSQHEVPRYSSMKNGAGQDINHRYPPLYIACMIAVPSYALSNQMHRL
jgi:hypothetical protein